MTTPAPPQNPDVMREQRLAAREARLSGQPPPGTEEGGTGLSAKWGPLPAWAWILIIAGVGLATILFIRARKNATTSSATTAPATTASTTASDGTSSADECTDSAGNATPCDQADYAGQIAALQAEVSNLQGATSTPLTTTTATTGTASTGTSAPATTTPAVAVPAVPATGASAAAPAT